MRLSLLACAQALTLACTEPPDLEVQVARATQKILPDLPGSFARASDGVKLSAARAEWEPFREIDILVAFEREFLGIETRPPTQPYDPDQPPWTLDDEMLYQIRAAIGQAVSDQPAR